MRVVPAQVVSSTIAVRADSRPEPLHLLDQLLATHPVKIVVHLKNSLADSVAVQKSATVVRRVRIADF